MKSYINDSINKMIKSQKKIVIKRKNNSLSKNNKNTIDNNNNNSKKLKIIKKQRLNSAKEVKSNAKKIMNSKLKLGVKTSLNKENNDYKYSSAMNSRNLKLFHDSITPPKKSKIKIIKKKNNSKSIGTMSTLSGDNFNNFFENSEENIRKIGVNNFNYNADSHSNKLETILLEGNKNNVNIFRYDTNSNEDNNNNDINNDGKIMLKCDNYSLLTFGNSFSYSNSQKRKNNKEFFSDDNKNNYINKLKEENEILRKELKESTEQISFLINKIKDLKLDNNFLFKKNNKKINNKSRNISIKINNKIKATYEKKSQNKGIINNIKRKQMKTNTNSHIYRDNKYYTKMNECISKTKI